MIIHQSRQSFVQQHTLIFSSNRHFVMNPKFNLLETFQGNATRVAAFLFLFFCAASSFAQGTLQATVTGGTATTDCTDFIGNPEPMFQVSFDGEVLTTYGYENCSPAFPNQQFSASYDCPADVSPTIQVCLTVIENDALNVFACDIDPEDGCTEEICQDFVLPLPGNSIDYTLAISDGGNSGGEVNFTLTSGGTFTSGLNDIICNAQDLGVLPSGGTIGDSSTEAFSNYCGTNTGDPASLILDGVSMFNDFGVWHQFTTSNTPSSDIYLQAFSSTNDVIHLQVAVFESDADCSGNLNLIGLGANRDDFNEAIQLGCPTLQPNTTYYILVDAFSDVQEEIFGNYSLEIIDGGSLEAGNVRCDAEELGVVPDNATVSPLTSFTNYCANNVGDPTASSFLVQQGVFFSFVAPASGNVLIEATTDANGVDPIALEMALYKSINNTCSGQFAQINVNHVEDGLNASLTTPCLTEGDTYFLMVDGRDSDVDGIFNISVTDLGDNPIETMQEPVVCAGESFTVGNNTYTSSGDYMDVFTLPSGCDSTVFTSLTVLQPINPNLELTIPATEEGVADGTATANPTGGTGIYTYAWDTGETTAQINNLVGGQTYCVTITDSNNCEVEDCIFVEFINNIVPLIQDGSVGCNGDRTGMIEVSAIRGVPPYTYTWEDAEGLLSGSGILNAENEVDIITDLPAGVYTFIFADQDDMNTDVIVEGIVTEPEVLIIALADNMPASCFEECDGSLSVDVMGGTMPYGYNWSTGETTADISGLCADNYSLTVVDANGCEAVFNDDINEPSPLVISINQDTPASEEGAADAVVTASTTGGAGNYTYLWEDGQTTAQATNLIGGQEYCVTATDGTGCTIDTCIIADFISNIEPLVENDLLDCNGDSDGQIRLTASEGTPPYNYTWQNDNNTLNGSGVLTNENDEAFINNLPAGTYSISITDNDDINTDPVVTGIVTQPEAIDISLAATENASCFGACDGSVEVEISGGTAPYTYSWSTANTSESLNNLCAGTYQLTVTDANGCTEIFSTDIQQPAEFIATATAVQSVSCFGGTDGQALVTTNGTPSAIAWNTGDTLAAIADLSAGIYSVTVTNMDGCTDETSIEIMAPANPVQVNISLEQAITCGGDSDGILSATVSGDGEFFDFVWNDGRTGTNIEDLPVGMYEVTVTNENGCEATASFELTAPEPIELSLSTKDITCLDGENGGAITVEEISGGVAPYEFSIDGILYTSQLTLGNLVEGQYDLWVKDDGGCERSFPATILGAPDIMVDLGEDEVIINLGDVFQLDPETNAQTPLFTWKGVDSLDCETCASIDVQPFETASYTVTVFDETTQCTATDEILVRVSKERRVYVPNAFSPNGEGRNEIFHVFGGDDVETVTMFRVFDRNGALLHEASNVLASDPSTGWDGTFRGKPLQTGIYTWFAEVLFIDGHSERYRGDVALVK